MKKAMIACVALIGLVGCSKLTGKSNEQPGGDTGTPASVGSTSTTGAGSILGKALSFLSGGPFEGAITMNMTSAGKTETMIYEVKGDKMRFDRPAGPDSGYAIVDGKKITSVDDKKKMAIVMDMNAMPTAGGAAAAAAAKKPNIEKTGKTDTVAGYSCDIWKITEDNGNKTEACLGKGIAFPAFGKSNDWTAELMADKSFPLRAVTTDASGAEKNKMEVTKIEKKSLDDSRFQVPAGYQVQNMEDMMKALGGAMGRKPH